MEAFQEELSEFAEWLWASLFGEPIALSVGNDLVLSDPEAVSAMVSVDGVWSGRVVVVQSGMSARAAAGALFDKDPADVLHSEVADTACEVANMIGGNLKSLMPAEAELGLPMECTYTAPDSLTRSFSETTRVDFDWMGGSVIILLGRERGAE